MRCALRGSGASCLTYMVVVAPLCGVAAHEVVFTVFLCRVYDLNVCRQPTSGQSMWAGVVSGSRRTCPKIARRFLPSELGRLSWLVLSATTVLETKSYQLTLRMRHVKRLKLRSSELGKVQVPAPYKRTETTSVFWPTLYISENLFPAPICPPPSAGDF